MGLKITKDDITLLIYVFLGISIMMLVVGVIGIILNGAGFVHHPRKMICIMKQAGKSVCTEQKPYDEFAFTAEDKIKMIKAEEDKDDSDSKPTAPARPPEIVRMQAPDGIYKLVPTKNLETFKKLGYIVAEGNEKEVISPGKIVMTKNSERVAASKEDVEKLKKFGWKVE